MVTSMKIYFNFRLIDIIVFGGIVVVFASQRTTVQQVVTNRLVAETQHAHIVTCYHGSQQYISMILHHNIVAASNITILSLVIYLIEIVLDANIYTQILSNIQDISYYHFLFLTCRQTRYYFLYSISYKVLFIHSFMHYRILKKEDMTSKQFR